MSTGWQASAPCAQADPDAWYPEKGVTGIGTAMAKRICAGCPYRVSCLRDAIDGDERHGIWGGIALGTLNGRRAAQQLLHTLTQDAA